MLHIPAPPSKSISHRMLMAASLASGETVISNVLESDDLFRTISVLQSGGVRFQRISDGVYTVTASTISSISSLESGSDVASCDVGESGTTCRLCTALLASGKGRFRIHGAPRMHERPMGVLTDVLKELGVQFTFEGQDRYPPFIMETEGLSGGEITLTLEESSQYLSGLLLAAPLAKEALTIYIGGQHVVSWPYVGLTLQVMKAFGIRFDVSIWDTSNENNPHWRAVDWKNLTEIIPGNIRFRVRPSQYKHGTYRVEGDWSGASYFLAAGALGKKGITVSGLNRHSMQADRAIIKILEQMGAKVEYGSVSENTVTVYPSPLKAISIDMSDSPDIVPTVAVLAAFAYGESHLYGVAHLRIKECDRLNAMATELGKLGVEVMEEADGLRIKGLLKEDLITQAMNAAQSGGGYGQLSQNISKKDVPDENGQEENREHDLENGEINENVEADKSDEINFSGESFEVDTYGDHRIAMSMALFMCAGANITFNDAQVVKKSFPNFWDLWDEVTA